MYAKESQKIQYTKDKIPRGKLSPNEKTRLIKVTTQQLFEYKQMR